ncbi:MAG: DUF2330 domain-containing protein [Vicinamibacterales bacterium]
MNSKWRQTLRLRAKRFGGRRSLGGGRLGVSKPVVIALTVLAGLGSASNAFAFCGFYVARAGTSLFNKASQIVLVRDGDWTVITMSSDCRGTLREFAVVIPLPTSITREQIHIADQALICHLDAYTAPRLVEYYDRDPCARPEPLYAMRASPLATSAMASPPRQDRSTRSA